MISRLVLFGVTAAVAALYGFQLCPMGYESHPAGVHHQPNELLIKEQFHESGEPNQ